MNTVLQSWTDYLIWLNVEIPQIYKVKKLFLYVFVASCISFFLINGGQY